MNSMTELIIEELDINGSIFRDINNEREIALLCWSTWSNVIEVMPIFVLLLIWFDENYSRKKKQRTNDAVFFSIIWSKKIFEEIISPEMSFFLFLIKWSLDRRRIRKFDSFNNDYNWICFSFHLFWLKWKFTMILLALSGWECSLFSRFLICHLSPFFFSVNCRFL